ncbi:hypothetical protein EG68_07996 [Paragonimus skrjabini miyazakii]|uniref:Uncharacterized protein n=1 Tax=Paragonimus skrjabini miyazakii TaxID=59628 RepID=A0A8S9YI09_9TREM|nr:hypothetical protein EG68_07996 [Paragonimus skrjabini miyazakii]
MSVSVLRIEISSKCCSVSISADGLELKLSRIRIQQLELQLVLKMEQYRIEYVKDVQRLNEQADSAASDYPAGRPLLSSPPRSSTGPVRPYCCAMEQSCNRRLDVKSCASFLPD